MATLNKVVKKCVLRMFVSLQDINFHDVCIRVISISCVHISFCWRYPCYNINY